tara:strand:+ start:2334 stop:6524 length:4191 start_codon:yes stop_codon:yes gene_type:complete
MANTNPEEKYYNKFGPDLNRDFLVRDQSFLADARKFLGERKDYSLRELRDPEEVYKLFIRHMRHANSNELAAVNDLRHINDLDDTGKAQVGKLYSVWDRMQGNKSGVLSAVRDYAGGIITAPSTYLSVITAGAGKLVGATGAVAARMAAREAALGALKKTIANQQLNIAKALPTNLAARRALTGAAGAGTVEGAVGATIGGAGEAVRTRADITGEREFRVSQPIVHGLLGVTGGAVLGGAVGAFTGRRQMAALGLIDEANQALAGKVAEAEKNVAKIVYGFGEEVPKSDKAVQEDKALYLNVFSFLRRNKDLEPLDPAVVERGLKVSRDLLRGTTDEIPPKVADDFTLMIGNRTQEEAADSIQGRLAGLVVDVIQQAKAYKMLDKDTLLDLSTDPPKNIKDITDIEVENLLTKRFSMIMHELLQKSTKDQKQNFVGDLLDKYNLTLGQLTDMYVADLSYAGTLLGGQSAIARSVMRKFAESVRGIQDVPVPVTRRDETGKEITEQMQITFTEEGEAFLNAMEKGQDTLLSYLTSRQPIQKAGGVIAEFDRFTKGFMTVQLATTARNTANATIRAPLYMLTNLLQGSFEYVTAAARRTQGDAGRLELKAVDMRKALSRMASPVMFLKHMLDPQTAKSMFRFFSRAFPREYGYFIRQLADIEGGQSDRLPTRFARKMNALNTFIDNAFKRAIYVTELGQRVGHQRLIQLSREGRFNEISFTDHLGATNAGLDFTYQTRFTGPGKTERLVTFEEVDGKTVTRVLPKTIDANTIGDTFVKVFSVPILGSGFIPYPRFVASFLKHTFEYAPFVGMIPLEKFGYRRAVPKLSKELREKIDAQDLVKIVDDNPTGDDARSILAEYKGGLDGQEWAKQKALAKRPLTNTEKRVWESYQRVGGDKAKQLGFILPGRTPHKIAAQQISGMALLYGAIQLRAAQGPEAEWYEMHKLPAVGDVARGMYADARAFYGVYAPQMLFADVLLRSTNFLAGNDPETIKNWVVVDEKDRKNFQNSARESLAAVALRGDKTDDYLEVAFGQAFKTGQGLAWADSISRLFQENPDMADEKVRNILADSIGDALFAYTARATVPFGMVKDVLGNVDPVWIDIPDDADVNPFMMGAYGDAKRRYLGVMTRAFPKKNILSDPETGEERRALFGLPFMALPKGFERGAVSPETTRLLRSEGGIQKQIFGIGSGRYKNDLQKEFSRLNMRSPWALFKRYDNTILDRVAKKYTAPHVEQEIIDIIRSPQYKADNIQGQRLRLRNALAQIREGLDDRIERLIGATATFQPEDPDIIAIKNDPDGGRLKHLQLVNDFHEVKFQRTGNIQLRAAVRRGIKEGKYPEFVKAGFPAGTILSEVTAMAKREDGSPKYTPKQIALVYTLARQAIQQERERTRIELDLN